MSNALLLYFSGSGSTKTISELLAEQLTNDLDITTAEMNPDFNYKTLNDYDFLIFGFPTYGFKPPEIVSNFLTNMPSFNKPKKAYAFTTYALYQENCLRLFISKAKEHNIYVNDYTGFKGPASDGALFFPESWKFVLSYEKNIKQHLDKTVNEIISLTKNENNTPKLPAPKWYAPINRLFVPMLEKSYKDMTKKMRVLPDRCTNCNYCVNNCPSKCWQQNDAHPQMNPENCILCLKCVHNCPSKAIWLSDSMKDRKRLNHKFYQKMKEQIIS